MKLQNGSDITCPECRKTSAVPTGGIEQLPNNFFINRIIDEVTLKQKVTGEEEVHCDHCIRDDPAVVLCFDCAVFLCTHCHESHKYGREYQGHTISHLKELREEKKDINVKPKSKPMVCQEHEMELNFYCDTCEQLVCHYCTTTDHHGHMHNTVKKMAGKHRLELDKIIEPVEKMIEKLSEAHQTVTAVKDKIQKQATEVDQQIDDYYEQLQQKLQQQREEQKKELHEVSTLKMKAISLQLEQMEDTQAQLESVKELNNAVKSGSDQEALLMKKQVTEDVKRLTDCYKKLKIETEESATTKFVPVEEYQDCFPQFANTFYGDADPLNSKAKNIPSLTYVNKTVKFTIVANNADGNLCSEGSNKIIAQARSSSTRDAIPVAIKHHDKDGSCSASFVASHAGELKLSVIINGKQIKGSPYSVSVRRNYHTLQIPNKIIDVEKMGKPWGIAFGKDGIWAVSYYTNNCVCIFDGQNKLVRKFGSQGHGNGQFDSPTGLAFDADNHLYVVCRFNHRVQRFRVNGEYFLKFGTEGAGNGQLYCPLGIIIHNDRAYVADQVNSRISVFQCDGKFIRHIGVSHLSDTTFDIAVNSNNNQLLVADKGNHCISIFTLDGSYVGKFGTQGSDKGLLGGPCGLIVDKYGFVFVIEGVNHRISIFDKDGIFIHCFGSKGSAKGQFNTNESLGIALSPSGGIYISDYNNKRIQIFSAF